MFLAGEATHETMWGTVDGAWESGERAAEAALRKIGALRDTEPEARRKPKRRSADPLKPPATTGRSWERPTFDDAATEGADFVVERQGQRVRTPGGQARGKFDVVGALTTVTETFDRVSIHGVRQEILRAQCEERDCRRASCPYPIRARTRFTEARMGEAVATPCDGITTSFSAICSCRYQAYRERKLAGTGIAPVFPLWERPTLPLAQR
jgi:hypothetical protein